MKVELSSVVFLFLAVQNSIAFSPKSPLKRQRSISMSTNIADRNLALTFAAGIATGIVAFRYLSCRKMTKEDDGNNECIYLDYNGTTPIHPLVLEAMLPFFTTHFGNPSSSHYYGKFPSQAVNQARASLLKMLDAPSSTPLDAILFTGCGTESNNMAIQLALQSYPNQSIKHVVTTNVEHPAIDVCLRRLMLDNNNVQVTFVPVNSKGIVSADDVLNAIRPDTVLVTIMLANNESGALQPVQQVAVECRKRGVLCHTDAAQAIGKIEVTLDALGDPDMITLVGHKIGAPKGVAALYVRPNCCNESGRNLRDGCILLQGGGQEGGRRGGTENVPYIVGMGKAADIVREEWQTNAAHMEAMRQRLLDNLTQQLGEDVVRPNGPSDSSKRLPNTLSVGLKGVQSGDLLAKIGNEVAASAGAACHSSGTSGISSVLVAMDVPTEYAKGTLRLSVGPTTTADDVDRAAAIICEEAKRQIS